MARAIVVDGDPTAFRHWFEDQITAPRHTSRFGGVDRGADGRVLIEVRVGNQVESQLVWRAGFKTACEGVRGYGHRYVPASLYVTDRIGMGRPGGDLFSGGRLTPARVATQATRIDALLGMPVSHLVEIGRTLIVIDDRRKEP